ncbi:MAG: 3,4-dihydroxy-2-butanone-4-phosphate synthase [Pseudomonadota bacterium]
MSTLATTQELLAELKAGRMIILIDEEDRENEGDLMLAAEFVTPEAINFMATYGRGLICLTLTKERCTQLGIDVMTAKNGTKTGTNFTASIEAAEGVTTGISAADRAHTIKTAVAKNARAEDIVQPGHIFPIMAQTGGVLTRAGHTEAGCDLTALAGLAPASVICEIMNEDGTMARLPELQVFAQKHGLKIGAITDLIEYRSATESLVSLQGKRQIDTAWGSFELQVWREQMQGHEPTATHLAIVHGKPSPEHETLVRVHEPVSLIDLIDIGHSSHSWPIGLALEQMKKSDASVLLLLHKPENADSLAHRALSTTPLNAHRMDLRNYGIGAQILSHIGVGKMRILGKRRKIPSMTGFKLDVTGFTEPNHQP